MSLTTPMKIIIAILLIGLIGAGFYVLDYKAKWDDLAGKQKELADCQSNLAKIKDEIKALPELTRQVEEKERELSQLVNSKITDEKPENFVANYVAEIERMVVSQQESTGDYDFDLTSISPGQAQTSAPPPGPDGKPAEGGGAPAAEALSAFPTRVFNMQMNGRYATLVDFLYQLGALKMDRLVTINKITLTPGKSEGNASPILSITIPITAYLKSGN